MYLQGWSTFCATCNRLLIVCANDVHGCGTTPAGTAVVTSTHASPEIIEVPLLPPNTVAVPSVFLGMEWCECCNMAKVYCRGH